MANIGKLRFNYRGLWVSGTAYRKDDVVKYGTGYYICNTDNSSTTSPRSRLTTNADTPGFAGTHWTLLSSTYNANRNEVGAQKMDYTGSNAVNRNNAWWASGTYYYGNIVLYRATDHVVRTYMCKVTSTTSTPTSTSNWDVIATGQGNPQHYVDLTVDRPFPNEGHHNSSDWAGDSTEWYGDTYGYPWTGTTYARDMTMWRNTEHGITGWIKGNMDTSGEWLPPYRGDDGAMSGSTASPWRSPVQNLDWMDGSLTTTHGNAPKVIQSFIGYRMAMALFDDGSIAYSGYGAHGQQGIGDSNTSSPGVWVRPGYGNINRTGATTVLKGKKAIRIAVTIGSTANNNYSCYAIVDNGNGTNTLYSWGYNSYGQLAVGDTTERIVPTAVTIPNGEKPVDVWAFGQQYGKVWVLTSVGKMYAAGYDNIGQLGVGSVGNKSSLTLVKDWTSLGGIKKFSSTQYQYGMCAVVTGNGQLWTWGENVRGQLGLSTTTDANTPTRVSTYTDVQNVWCCGHNQDNTMFFTRGSSQINNTLYACGENGNYQLSNAAGNTTDTGANAPNIPLDSFGNNLTNIVDVRWGEGGGNAQSVMIEKYVGNASTNEHWYQTDWYLGGRRTNGSFAGYAGRGNTYNYYDFMIPNASTTADRYRYHRNARYTPSLNPYRMGVMIGMGRNGDDDWMIWDRDTGQVWFTGGGQHASPANGPEGDDIVTEDGNGAYGMVCYSMPWA
jgi:hypothetical protein